jgi:hypothetical protein
VRLDDVGLEFNAQEPDFEEKRYFQIDVTYTFRPIGKRKW